MSDTRVLYLPQDEASAVGVAVATIQEGGLVVIPTETIYGLTCDATNSEAVGLLFATKGRSLDKSSAVFVRDREALAELAFIETKISARIIESLLPGPLTVVLRSRIPATPGVVGTDGKIGIRVSSDPFVEGLAREAGKPLIATSANRSGGPDCRTPEDLLSQFANRLPVIILRPGQTVAASSTVVDLSGRHPVLLREGTLPFAEVLKHAESDLGDV